MSDVDKRYLNRSHRNMQRGPARPWRAYLRWEGEARSVGYFSTKEEADRYLCRVLEEIIYGDPLLGRTTLL